MPKRASKSRPSRAIATLGVIALVLFVAGEAMVTSRSDAWRIAAARHLGIGDPARVTQLVGLGVRRALTSVGVPADSIKELPTERGPLRWRVGLKPGASLLQANYAITRRVESDGAVVLAGREHAGSHGESEVTLRVGLPRRATHEIVLVRPTATLEQLARRSEGRLALVLYGFGDDSAATAFLGSPLPFAAAVVPGGKQSRALIRAARAHQRELVLHLPLEPINYPQVNPGPGTVLVTMKPEKIAALVDRYLDEAGPVTAVANDQGSLATQDMTVMSAVYGELRRRELPFLHMLPAAGSVCRRLASDVGVAYETPDEVIDLEPCAARATALDRRWNEALKRARARGDLIVMIRATPLTRRWLPQALDSKRLKGVSLVPLESLLRRTDGA